MAALKVDAVVRAACCRSARSLRVSARWVLKFGEFRDGAELVAALLFACLIFMGTWTGPVHGQESPDVPADAADQAGAAEAPAASPDQAQVSDPAAALFSMKCAGCHTIGGGALAGPDLKTAVTYPRQTVIDSVKRMEKQVGPLSADEVETLVEFLLSLDAANRLTAQQQHVAMQEAASLEPPSAKLGEALFMGAQPFQNGALSCAACHQAGGRGGNLAISLEDAYTRLGEQAIVATTVSPGFPVMRAMYTPKPITRQEAAHIVKFLEEVAQDPAEPVNVPLHVAGIVGAAGVMFLLARVTRSRAAGTRARLVAGANRRRDSTAHGQGNH